MSQERLLRLREKMKRKRPQFLHQEHWKMKKFRKAPWRKPRGKRSKMRAREKAKPCMVRIGYRGPQKVRDWHPRGVPEVYVHRVEDLIQVDTEVVVRVASAVGTRKKIEIMKVARERNLYVVNSSIPLVKVSTVEELESLIPLKECIRKWCFSEKASEDEREKMTARAEEAGIEVVE